ncbi:Kunitz/Bovine pancreatic trypsin inhibitor domain protein, partial [Ostertagia ostertagi]
TNPCAEPWTKGEGEATLTRFYYDSIKRKCLAFNYFGTKGNQNNFLTKELCEVGILGYLPSMGESMRCWYYCHIGFDESTTVCCQSQGDPCSLVVKEGLRFPEHEPLVLQPSNETVPTVYLP